MPSYHRYMSLVIAQLALASAWERLHDPLRIRQYQNLQVFNHGLTGAAPAITNSGHRDKPSEVHGEMFCRTTKVNIFREYVALMAPNIVNEVHGINFTVQDCQSERESCNVAQQSAPTKYFIEHVQKTAAVSSESALAPTSPSHQVVMVLDDEFELLCDVA
ncbi:hypothetical protein PAAG_02062 [Paracoccidioides lutzii Pb01]|uniref:Uncharacterized protein n=1 Tax=Paracoccidioides lutzii (strain ATCC MYA-826 / Pb01) TaxID=502779 RepID=C1GU67_PARBA|nr:hypothetical protein PAAG_02062 [Paracoccidioides lutzii Pb01]EEH39873.2 hypothetical protein PAAG_02062 [Paracoccidioides lutzii Pb01]